ncbi:MAG: NAD(P)/FAD-dependent oxidoreductase [Deltaproteobacteria bacterium]|nr:NAD(P)/FAD-dependent oxidoreductase [Deltaproteobacteria bacterium]
MPGPDSLRIAVIGAGPSGLATGHELLARGFTNFTIFEKSDAPGGTWHNESYPGLACDVWAHSYTFSYRPNPDWTASFVEQPEIEAYLQRCAIEFGLDPHIRLNARITQAHYQQGGFWKIRTAEGQSFEFDVVINAMGNQHTALYPDVKGMNSFEGESWHSTEWRHDVDLTGKHIAIVGSAASAVQIVPEVAKQAARVTVLQRTPNWIMPRGRRFYSEAKRAWYRRIPALVRFTQWTQRFMMSFVHEAATIGHKRMEQFEARARKFIDETIDDPELREVLTPKSHYACKRGLVSDDFYPALNQEHVELVASGLDEVRPRSIVVSGGREIEVDAIAYCTGYRILDFDRIEVIGARGESLAKVMAEGPEAYKGIAAPDFPNYFFAVGPNGLVLNVPYFMTVEQNVATIVRLLEEKERAGLRAIGVKADRNRAYNDWMLDQFPLYSWGEASCNSYYRQANGRAPFLFPGDFKAYRKLQNEMGLQDFDPA